ncbi:immunity 52 family protein [Myxococcaceae bacterium GXIMD 01537]
MQDSARRAEAFFRQLSSVDTAFQRWFEQARSREAALKSQFAPDAATLSRLFAKKKYEIVPGEFSFTAWNGEAEGSCVVSFSCGAPSVNAADLCVLSLPQKGLVAERLLSVPVLTQLMRAMVRAWEPEWAVVVSHALRDELSKSAALGTYVGWMTYLSDHRGALPVLPAPTQVEPVEAMGTLITLSPERLESTNPEHVALALRVQELLAGAGLLGPVRRRP